jgi:mannobiose 2-epimerase
VHGGFYWSVTAKGEMLDGKKQIYGQAFAIYGLAEYHKATGDESALDLAKSTFNLIEKYSFDTVNLGYIEAYDQAWQSLQNLRLSDKDLNADKSMNTHLHIIEAYANLYAVWKDERLAKAIRELLSVFKKFIITDTHHLSLFFTANWQRLSTVVSYGHDIEAAWLLLECAESLSDETVIDIFKKIAIELTVAAAEGIDQDGGMFDENEKHWWPQAEAMVGFFNAYQIDRNANYLSQALKSWSFIKTYLKDHANGEWYWGIYPDGTLMDKNKAGFWKCPYHNARACMEIFKRITSLQM